MLQNMHLFWDFMKGGHVYLLELT